jgi:FtsP/CotA-like multicopper oxidase with cupredoxin domain
MLARGWPCLLLLACSSDESDDDDPLPPDAAVDASLAEGDAGADAAVPDEPAFPPVLGVEPLEDVNDDPAVVEVELTATLVDREIEDDLTLPMMAYNGLVPGPLLQARVGDEIVVHFTNDLDQPTTIHWHGLRISDQMDGSPRIQDPVPPGGTFEYRFVAPEAGSFWYHPHVAANEQIERGLYAPIVIRDQYDPEYDAERYLLLDDALVDPEAGDFVPFLANHMEAMHGRFGNLLLTNGRPSPEARAEVDEGTVERWRIVNTANARTMELELDGASFRVIGTDGGLLREPYDADYLFVAVGQRYDVEVRYDQPGTAEMLSIVPTVDENGDVRDGAVPTFTVEVTATGVAPREIPWPDLPARPVREADEEVTITMTGEAGGEHGLMWMLNGEAHPEEPLFEFREGETVRMILVNDSGMVEHPFHLHGQFFEILDDETGWPGQPGLKDVVLVPGSRTVEILAYFDNPGRWMAHCHILEHQELGMMGEIVVEPQE